MMLTEEWGLRADEPPPLKEALSTFSAFSVFGFLPLAPYLVPVFDAGNAFVLSTLLTGAAFAGVGLLKGVVTRSSLARSAAQTLLTGGAASALAFGVGALLRSWVS